MSGTLTVIGLGPGAADLITPAATHALAEATDLIGYGPYLNRIPEIHAGQNVHASDNRVELDRARHALTLAAGGRRVAVVSGGDPGVFAMAAAVFEAIEKGEPAWRDLDVRVEPGVTAMLAAAASVGAPLGGDFCAISLSDNLKSWSTIERRLKAAAEADFVIALYNAASKARPYHLDRAFDFLRSLKSGETVTIFVRAAGTDEAKVTLATLAEAKASYADMRTLVIAGSSRTRLIERPGRLPFIYTPRSEDLVKNSEAHGCDPLTPALSRKGRGSKAEPSKRRPFSPCGRRTG